MRFVDVEAVEHLAEPDLKICRVSGSAALDAATDIADGVNGDGWSSADRGHKRAPRRARPAHPVQEYDGRAAAGPAVGTGRAQLGVDVDCLGRMRQDFVFHGA